MSGFCRDCPDHEACGQAYPCDVVKRVNAPRCRHCLKPLYKVDGMGGWMDEDTYFLCPKNRNQGHEPSV